jgi:hypothetical protein
MVPALKSSRSRRYWRVVTLAAALTTALAASLVFSRQASADGAFPDSMQIFAPSDHPHRIILATTFGLIISEDDGATWEWACEPSSTDKTILYQKAAAPSERLFAVQIIHGLVYSDDLACSWTPSGGSLATAIARDAFTDPTSASRVFAIAAEPADAMIPSSAFRSDDGGLTFGPALFTAPATGDLLGVESATSDPATVYLAMYANTGGTGTPMLDPMLARSSDGGTHWTSMDVAAALGASVVRIIAVDPTDPRRLFLRITEKLDEKLGVSTDGGLTFSTPITVSDQLSSFVRLANGTILVGGMDNNQAVAYRSTDNAKTFVALVKPPHLNAMAERDGKLYVGAENFIDHFAVGVSTDEGATFQPLLTYNQVKRTKPCVQQVCLDVCDNLGDEQGLGLWPQAVCGDEVDAGSDGGPTTPTKSGCGCRTAGGDEGAVAARGGWLTAALLSTGLIASWRRRRQRR